MKKIGKRYCNGCEFLSAEKVILMHAYRCYSSHGEFFKTIMMVKGEVKDTWGKIEITKPVWCPLKEAGR